MIASVAASARGLAAESALFRFVALLTGACTILYLVALVVGSGGGNAGGGGGGGGPQSGSTPASSPPPSFATQPASQPTTPPPVGGGGQAYSFNQPAQAVPPADVTVHSPVVIDPHHPIPVPASSEPFLDGTPFSQLK
jgi:hypothetical protein